MDNKLDGPVPPSLFNISSITVIKLGFNRLVGSLPLDIGFKLPKLIVLATFANNYFEGQIPASLSNASELQYLELRENRYHGLIPRDIGIHGKLKMFSVGHNELQTTKPRDWEFLTSLTNCSNLVSVDLEQNNFVGAMPVTIANLSRELEWLTIGTNHIAGTVSWVGMFQKLTKLNLSNNLFTGTLPIEIGQLSSLQFLDLSHNGFEGQIPQSLGNITPLSSLSLSNNFLNNSIPASLGKLTNIGSMDLSCNLLTSQIPQEILSIPSLTRCLNLSTNALSGAIPTQIGHLNSLGTMDLSMNKLDGEISEAIEGCVQLRFLYLQGNLLQGQLPKGLNNLVALEKMDLSSNNLTGPIPKFLESMRSLNYLNLSFNNLSGPVPDTGVFVNATGLSVTGNIMLCGGPPFLQLPSCPSIPSHKASAHRLHIFIFGAIGLFIFCVCSVTAYCFIKRRTTSTFVHREFLFFNEEHERISYAELHKATGSFSPANLIGSGSSGKVYFGNLT
jgi:Leucine-rich repeat (LRR) protein